jgi:tetratricopeptide (TPR) repeat protein
MRVGYAASRQGDFNTALINFRRALAIRPNQPYAQAAADNMAYYLQYERIAIRQRAIAQLEARLTRATSQKDWVCAATTLDALTLYTEPNSLNRERLIGQRGEISGLLDARIDHDRWSTVCAAQNPVY